MTIGSNVSALGAYQTHLNNSAQNVANVNTERYVPTRTTLHEGAAESVRAVSGKPDDSGQIRSQTELSKELSDQIVIEGGSDANVVAIKTRDDILGTLLDLKA